MYDTSYQGISLTFGDILEDIALAFPISKPRLVDAIDSIDETVRRREHEIKRRGDVYVYPDAILVSLPVSVWLDIEATADLLPFEAVATRTAHHRFANSFISESQTKPRRSRLVLDASGSTMRASD